MLQYRSESDTINRKSARNLTRTEQKLSWTRNKTRPSHEAFVTELKVTCNRRSLKKKIPQSWMDYPVSCTSTNKHTAHALFENPSYYLLYSRLFHTVTQISILFLPYKVQILRNVNMGSSSRVYVNQACSVFIGQLPRQSSRLRTVTM